MSISLIWTLARNGSIDKLLGITSTKISSNIELIRFFHSGINLILVGADLIPVEPILIPVDADLIPVGTLLIPVELPLLSLKGNF